MTISLWIIVGMIAAWLARHAVPEDSSDGMLQNLIMGVIGALAGGMDLPYLRPAGRLERRGPHRGRALPLGLSGTDQAVDQGPRVTEWLRRVRGVRQGCDCTSRED
jgi:hypothetical protein